jgi:hypothetical protein
MLDMAERAKKTKHDKQVQPRPEPPRERLGVNLNVWLPAELMAAFEEMRSVTVRTKTAEATVMMMEYLKAHGFWPRKKEER